MSFGETLYLGGVILAFLTFAVALFGVSVYVAIGDRRPAKPHPAPRQSAKDGASHGSAQSA